MSLTLGALAPFGRPTGGSFNFELPDRPAHLLYLHGLPARIRGLLNDVAVVDTTEACMLHETAILPRWYFRRQDVRTDLLEPSDTVTHCPFKGDARYWDLRVGDRLITDAFWEYPETVPTAPPLAGLLSPYTEKFDCWLDEDEEVIGHPIDPFHRVDARRSSRRVTVRLGDTVVARSEHPVSVNETGLPTRWYVPLADVDPSVLEPSATTTVCAYKGVARYWHLHAGDRTVADAVWSYPEPRPEAVPAVGCVSFLGQGVVVEVG